MHSGEPQGFVGSGLESTDRRVLTSWGTRSVMLSRVVPGTPEQVWAVVSDADHLAMWLGPVVGRLEISQVVDFSGAIVEIVGCRPPHRLELRWRLMGETNDLRLDLRPVAGGTEVTVEHAGLVNPAAVGYGPSWEERLQHLAEYLSGAPAPQHDCGALLAQVQPLWWALLAPADRQALGLPE